MQLVSLETGGDVVTITLSDPPKRNALSTAMREQLFDALTRANADPNVRAIVLTGAAGTFCSGGDFSEMSARSQLASRSRLVRSTDLARLMLTGPKPIVAAVEGAAMGAGLSLAAACDFVVASRDARMSAAFLRVGLLPDLAALWSIPRRVGLAKAQELFGLSPVLDGVEAVRIGLANNVAEPGTTLVRAREVALDYVNMAPVAMAALRGALGSGFTSIDAAIQFELVAQPLVQRTCDHREAILAFGEKRRAIFNGD